MKINNLDKTQLFLDATDNEKIFIFLYQDKNYIQWRMIDNPYPSKYEAVQIIDSKGKIAGDVVYSINKNTAYIEQIIFNKNLKNKDRLALISNIIEKIKTNNISLIRFLGFYHNPLNKSEIDLLKKIGFTFIKPAREGTWFVWKSLSNKNGMIEVNNVVLSKLYFEGT